MTHANGIYNTKDLTMLLMLMGGWNVGHYLQDLVMIIQKVYSRRKSFLNGMHVIWLDAAELYGENGVSLCLFISPGIGSPARLCYIAHKDLGNQ